ncbi:complement C1q tumor necrosis factor-related protein 6-like [Pecten maximus]|uniref:complement C1q tumor necrosis factor-related protein 6-like n=1 Tax=Pecten maximus TaxID=6579 RepID=UPI0014582F00|nr:complement C1q tumor necrosis factor-related protein 6-like [Pecten maximus]
MHLSVICMVAILSTVTLVNGDKEKYSNYYANRKQLHKEKPSRGLGPLPPPLPKEEEDDDETSGCTLKVECKNKKGEPGYPGPEGLPGLFGPRGVNGYDGQKGEKGEPGLSGFPVSFLAALDANEGPLDGQVLKYKQVLINRGLAYDKETGIFTAPSPGVYVFHIVVAAMEGQKAAVQLFQTGDGDDQWVVTVWAESLPSWGTSSNTIYLPLTQGQRVYLIARPNLNSYYYAGRYTTFSGHKVASEV